MTRRTPALPDTADQRGPTQVKLIRKVLVANRGEIARRILRTCREMGIAAVAVYSDIDAGAPYVREADEAIRLGGSAAAATYLDIAKLLDAARRTNADAVHPGYGFLAENPDFAAACRDAGLRFIGPSPEVIGRMGSKREAKQLMAAASIPVVPGYSGEDQSDGRFVAAAREVGYPVMVKASAGGGGKGMRVVEREGDLPDALAAARREALAAFGDGALLLEKAIVEPRHVEFQIFGDTHGNIIHLGERECTIQRRHQKIVEETPSAALTPGLRARMAEAALAVGRTLGYTNAGTVEFILDPHGAFYFLEVNTRLQVEHPVTELVTGLDLVRWQVLVAEGRPLPLRQDEVTFRGHAVEARIYAEDPANGFLPATGSIALWRPPAGVGVRCDDGIATGDEVSAYYDPMLAKISAHGADRAEALRRLDTALGNTILFGVRTNLAFLRRVLLHPAHVVGELSTAFIERHASELLAENDTLVDGLPREQIAALLVALRRHSATAEPLGYWRNNPNGPLIDRFDVLSESEGANEPKPPCYEVRLTPRRRDTYDVTLAHAGSEWSGAVCLRERSGPDLAVEIDGYRLRAVVAESADDLWWVHVCGATAALRWRTPLPVPNQREAAGGSLRAPMPGQVIAVLAAEGQRVAVGDPLLILEAMKMEHTVRAPRDGLVAAIHFRAGERVPAGAELVRIT